MSEYTPTADQMFGAALYGALKVAAESSETLDGEKFRAQWDRMIAEVERAAAEKAWAEGARWAAVECGTILHEGQEFLAPGDNPYRLNEGEKQ